MSWESSAEYDRLLNQGVRTRRGPSASARCLLWSFDFAEIEALQHAGDWTALATRLADAATRLHGTGAELLVLCTNTMHRVAPAIEAAVPITLLHIADPTAERIRAAGLRRVGLLGTAFTMEQSFLPRPPRRRPYPPASRDTLAAIVGRLAASGAEAVILGCTELMLLLRPEDSPVPLFDTTAIHVEAALDLALAPHRG